jgi:hypothetical protein
MFKSLKICTLIPKNIDNSTISIAKIRYQEMSSENTAEE